VQSAHVAMLCFILTDVKTNKIRVSAYPLVDRKSVMWCYVVLYCVRCMLPACVQELSVRDGRASKHHRPSPTVSSLAVVGLRLLQRCYRVLQMLSSPLAHY
jgi:hypothetical protein